LVAFSQSFDYLYCVDGAAAESNLYAHGGAPSLDQFEEAGQAVLAAMHGPRHVERVFDSF
jgi:hypothetical protein